MLYSKIFHYNQVTELEKQLIEDTKMQTELQHQLAEYPCHKV